MNKKLSSNKKWSISFDFTEFHYFFDKRTELHNKTFKKRNNEVCKITEEFLDRFCNKINQWDRIDFPKENKTHITKKDSDYDLIFQNLKNHYSDSYQKIIEFDEDQKCDFFSQNTNGMQRIIYFIYYKEKIIFPIIFDLHHLLISTKTKNKSIKKHNQGFEWNLEKNRKAILKFINKKITIEIKDINTINYFN